MAKTPLSRAALLEHLEVQRDLLADAAELFDEGRERQSRPMAAAIRNLCHHTADTPRGSSHALLEQLHVRTIWQYVETHFVAKPATVVDEVGLINMTVGTAPDGTPFSMTANANRLVVPGRYGGRQTWIAPLASVPARAVNFDQWWNGPAVDTDSGHTFSRWELVRIVANQDGGTHVDPKLDDDYKSLVLTDHSQLIANDVGDWTVREPPNGWSPLTGNVAAQSIRQITHELLTVLDREIPHLA